MKGALNHGPHDRTEIRAECKRWWWNHRSVSLPYEYTCFLLDEWQEEQHWQKRKWWAAVGSGRRRDDETVQPTQTDVLSLHAGIFTEQIYIINDWGGSYLLLKRSVMFKLARHIRMKSGPQDLQLLLSQDKKNVLVGESGRGLFHQISRTTKGSNNWGHQW